MTADVRDRLRQLTEAQKAAALTAVLDLADGWERQGGYPGWYGGCLRAVVAAAGGDGE